MSIDAREFFKKFDSHVELEKPSSLNREELLKSIRIVVDEISHVIGDKFVVNDAIQDASFCAEVSLGQIKTDMGIFDRRLVFSNFGRMVTINDPDIPQSLMHSIRRSLEGGGFNYIEFCDAELEYDGLIQDNGRIRTWFNRFFDYL